tara:strand:- start:633 stop:1499 length:867 start_codon:yes stop_codon:yes gene_type:complete
MFDKLRQGRKVLRLLGVLAAAGATLQPHNLAAELVPVDVELVLAVDVSGSVDWHEAELQRDGYIQVIKSPDFVKVIQTGFLGKIAVTYIEWAGDGYQTEVVDWAIIKDQSSADAFAKALKDAPIDTGPWTSISDVINYAVPKFFTNNYQGTRRILDISGDGPNNTGTLVTGARDAAIKRGITINGLPIINDRLQPSGRRQIANLDKYYAACVIGGPGAFLVVAHSFKDFARAIRRKMIFEIAGTSAGNWRAKVDKPPSLQHNIALLYPPGCDIGERRLQRRRSFGDEF